MTVITEKRAGRLLWAVLVGATAGFLLLNAVGCSPPGTFEPRPGQAEFEQVVWRDVFGEEGAMPPVEWRAPECVQRDGSPGVWSYNIAGGAVFCRDGFYWLTGGVVVLQQPGKKATDWVTLVHELYHAHAWRALRGDADPRHERMDWDVCFDAIHALVAERFCVEGWVDPRRTACRF